MKIQHLVIRLSAVHVEVAYVLYIAWDGWYPAVLQQKLTLYLSILETLCVRVSCLCNNKCSEAVP